MAERGTPKPSRSFVRGGFGMPSWPLHLAKAVDVGLAGRYTAACPGHCHLPVSERHMFSLRSLLQTL